MWTRFRDRVASQAATRSDIPGAATVVSNVVNYYVTVALDSGDPRLRPGMTTNATVITAEADNVLTKTREFVLVAGPLSPLRQAENASSCTGAGPRAPERAAASAGGWG